jgi:hypothetical protein
MNQLIVEIQFLTIPNGAYYEPKKLGYASPEMMLNKKRGYETNPSA